MLVILLLIFEKDGKLRPTKGKRQTKDPPFFGLPWTKQDQADWNAYWISGEIYPWAMNLSDWRPTIYQAYRKRPLNWWTVGIGTPSAKLALLPFIICVVWQFTVCQWPITYPRRSMPTWKSWSWNHISTSHCHGKQKSQYNPKRKRGAWWMDGTRALPQQIKS